MRPARKRRLYLVLLILIGAAAFVSLAMWGLGEYKMFFFKPSEVARGETPPGRAFKIGGLVKEGSVRRNGKTVEFTITDTLADVVIRYTASPPDLFREGQGIVADGRLNADGVFEATNVLAKHDENYMPPEVAEALKESGAMPPHEIVRPKPGEPRPLGAR